MMYDGRVEYGVSLKYGVSLEYGVVVVCTKRTKDKEKHYLKTSAPEPYIKRVWPTGSAGAILHPSQRDAGYAGAYVRRDINGHFPSYTKSNGSFDFKF